MATDNRGASATTTPIALVSDAAPSVNLTSPAANSTVVAPASLNLAASATSQIGTIAKVEFYNGTTLIGSATAGTGGSYSYTWANVPAGSYSLSAKATDSYGLSASSAAVTVTVKSAELVAYYIHPDQLGTPREITDQAGNVVWQWDNADPYGNNVPNENPTGAGQFSFPLRFPGQYADRETNTYYNVNRDYDAAVGRYIQSDPIGLQGGVNTYTYVAGNPISYRDPNGEELFGALVGTVAGVSAGYVSGGYTGAFFGGVAGAIVGLVAPQYSYAVGEMVGGEIAGAIASASAFQAQGVAAAAAATAATNAVNGDPLNKGMGWAVSVGVMAPLASGEMFTIAAGSEAVGTIASNSYSTATGVAAVVGAAMDPGAQHGLTHNPSTTHTPNPSITHAPNTCY